MSEGAESKIVFKEDAVYITVDEKVYGLPAILKTSYSFTDKCYVLLSSEGEFLIVRIAPLEDSEAKNTDFKQLAKEFCNQLLEQRMRQQVLSETGEIRETIMTRAFLSGNITF